MNSQEVHYGITIFRCDVCDRVAQMAVESAMMFALVSDVCIGLMEGHPFICTGSVSWEFSLCHFGD